MKKLIAVGVAAAALAVIPASADAAVRVERCAWWDLDNGDELVVDAIGNSTSCRVARAVGDAYLARPGWYPYHLRAIGRRWRRTQHEYGGSRWRYRVIQYQARDRRGKWLSVHLTYQW